MKNIVLIGLSGSGKSTFGKRLAARYQMPLVDMDEAKQQMLKKELINAGIL